MKELGQKETPRPLFDTLIDTVVSKFKSQDSFLERNGDRSGYTLRHAASDTIGEIIRTKVHDSRKVFMELVNKSGVKPTDLDGEDLDISEYEPESWDEFLNVASKHILRKTVEDLFPELAEEAKRRYDRFA